MRSLLGSGAFVAMLCVVALATTVQAADAVVADVVDTVVEVTLDSKLSGNAEAAEANADTTAPDAEADNAAEAPVCDACGDAGCSDGACSAAGCDDQPCEDAPSADETAAADDGELDHDDGVYRATHSQKQLLKVHVESLPKRMLKTFCLAPDGRVFAACGASSEGDVRIFSPEGELLSHWEIDFEPEAINVGSDDRLYVAGQGTLARYELDGKLVNTSDAPHAEALRNSREDMREQVIASHKSQFEWMTEYVEDLEGQIEEIDKRIAAAKEEAEAKAKTAAKADEEAGAEDADADEAAPLSKLARWLSARATGRPANQSQDEVMRESLQRQLTMYEQMLERQGGEELTEEQIEERIDRSIAYKMKVASISESDGEVFFATGAKKGYGFAVWRTSRHFDNAEEIITGLSGCCGQMDVQACCDGIFVAENSRHRVACFDRQGNELRDWGSGDRNSVEGFASCCNPMNVAFGADGSVYTAESKVGRVKKYTKEGVLTSLVGKVDLIPGCDKVTIAVSPEGDRVYMLDITRNHIVVLQQAGEGEQIAYTEKSAGPSETESMVDRLLEALGGGG